MTALMTTNAHPHPITAKCPLGCLEGILPARALNQLRHELPAGTVGDAARLFLEDQLLQIRGIGAGGVERIRETLTAAGLTTREARA